MNLIDALKRNTLGISVFAVATAGLIAVTQVTTADLIVENQRAAKAKALYQVVPAERIDNQLLDDTLEIVAPSLSGDSVPVLVNRARKGKEVVAVVIPVIAPDGYSGAIQLIVGVLADGSVSGVRVLSHKETPGLGDKVDLKKSPWILGFNGQSKEVGEDARWFVKKDGGDFDQFTGATITPRAVVGAVSRVLSYFEQHRVLLLDQEKGEVRQ